MHYHVAIVLLIPSKNSTRLSDGYILMNEISQMVRVAVAQSRLEYANALFGLSKRNIDKLQRVQSSIAQV
jgi:hypothetical protein